MLQEMMRDAAGEAVRRVVKALPLPVSLPEPLRRAEGPTRADELRGNTAILDTLRDDLDCAVAEALLDAGADVWVIDAQASSALVDPLCRPRSSGARLQHAPLADTTADDLATSLGKRLCAREVPLRPALYVHRVRWPAAAPRDAIGSAAIDPSAALASLERLYTVGHAAARTLPPTSRVLFYLDDATGPDAAPDAPRALLRAGLGGFARSLSKELGKKGTTVHTLERGAGVRPVRLARALAWLASPRASFLTALDIHCGFDAPGPVPAFAGATPTAPRRLLDGKVAIVTGAARGIGAAIALAFAREGAAIGLNDLPGSERAAADTLKQIRALGVHACFLPFDVATEDGARALAAAVTADLGQVDALVNNAGITRDRTIARMKPEVWRQAVEVNLGTQLRVTEALEPLLQPGASIVNLSSVMGIAGNFGQTNYATAKAATIGFTRGLAARLGPRGVRANALAPGFIQTRLTAAMPLVNREMAKQLTALLQAGEPEDVAQAALFLCGPDSAAIQGQVLRVDGGMAIGA